MCLHFIPETSVEFLFLELFFGVIPSAFTDELILLCDLGNTELGSTSPCCWHNFLNRYNLSSLTTTRFSCICAT